MTPSKPLSPLTMFLGLIVFFLLLPSYSVAHVRWALDSVTPPRTNDTGLKANPCGGAVRTNRSTTFSAGQTIDLEFEETINHPGHYRIAFSPADDLNFDSGVLVDNIPDETNNGRYIQQVTIPNEICSACTLQLIQVMTTDPDPQPGDYYYSCSDIQITNAGDTTAPLPINSLSAQASNSQALLSWNNPTDDFYQVVILKSTNPIFELPINGSVYSAGDNINGTEVIYVGNNSTYNATSLTNDTQYYFKAFSQNPRKNYANGVEINVTPVAPGDDTGNEPGGNPANQPDSGGGSVNLFYLVIVLVIRLMAARKLQ